MRTYLATISFPFIVIGFAIVLAIGVLIGRTPR